MLPKTPMSPLWTPPAGFNSKVEYPMPTKGEPFSRAMVATKATKAKKAKTSKQKHRKHRKSKGTSRKRKGKSLSRRRLTSLEVQSRPKACECGTHTYTGTEVTPRGFGRCEECIPEHVVLVGRDGKLYRNTGTAWVKVECPLSNIII